MASQIQLRRGTAAQWTTSNPVLASGEQGLETDTRKIKTGDGLAAWSALAYPAAAGGTVTSVTGSGVVTTTGTAAAPIVGITEDATHRFATDAEKVAWNAKQPAGTYATGTGTASGSNTGDQTNVPGNAGTASALSAGADRTKLDGIATGAQVNPAATDNLSEGTVNLYFTVARVRAALLAGLSTATATVVDATHTVLQAVGFLQKQVSDNTTAIAGKQATLSYTPYDAANPAAYIASGGAPVQSVGGFTGGVTKTQLAINNVDNTADASKPVSTAQANADTAVQNAAASDATTKANAAQAASTPVAHAGSGGTAHANVVAGGAAGFISGADKTKLDGIASGAQVNPATTDGLTEGATNLYATAARVRATLVAGLSTATATVVDATHTLLQAIGFLQKQASDNATAIATKASLTGAETLTNKRVNPRVLSALSSATPSINTDTCDIYKLTAQAADITSFSSGLTGTPVDGQCLIVEITGTAARAIAWGASFESSTVDLPTTTVTTALLAVGFIYNSVTAKFRCVGAV